VWKRPDDNLGRKAMARFMKADIIAIAANFFIIGICVGAQWYLEWFGWVVIVSVLFVTWQVWQRLTADLAAVSRS
jgi:hypothetical protein